MRYYATQNFPYAGRSVSIGDDITEEFSQRELSHFLVGGHATAVPEESPA